MRSHSDVAQARVFSARGDAVQNRGRVCLPLARNVRCGLIPLSGPPHVQSHSVARAVGQISISMKKINFR